MGGLSIGQVFHSGGFDQSTLMMYAINGFTRRDYLGFVSAPAVFGSFSSFWIWDELYPLE